jgi:hypothetical protein
VEKRSRNLKVPLTGFKMYVRLDDWDVGCWIALRRRHEPHVTAVLEKHLFQSTA